MNKSELIKIVAEENNISTEEAVTIVNTFFDTVQEELLQGNRVEIRGFGSFKIKEYKGYQGRNPRSGQPVSVKPKRLPFFRPGKNLRDFINQ